MGRPPRPAAPPPKPLGFQEALEAALAQQLGQLSTWEPTERNTFFALAIKFVAVKGRIALGEYGTAFDGAGGEEVLDPEPEDGLP